MIRSTLFRMALRGIGEEATNHSCWIAVGAETESLYVMLDHRGLPVAGARVARLPENGSWLLQEDVGFLHQGAMMQEVMQTESVVHRHGLRPQKECERMTGHRGPIQNTPSVPPTPVQRPHQVTRLLEECLWSTRCSPLPASDPTLWQQSILDDLRTDRFQPNAAGLTVVLLDLQPAHGDVYRILDHAEHFVRKAAARSEQPHPLMIITHDPSLGGTLFAWQLLRRLASHGQTGPVVAIYRPSVASRQQGAAPITIAPRGSCKGYCTRIPPTHSHLSDGLEKKMGPSRGPFVVDVLRTPRCGSQETPTVQNGPHAGGTVDGVVDSDLVEVEHGGRIGPGIVLSETQLTQVPGITARGVVCHGVRDSIRDRGPGRLRRRREAAVSRSVTGSATAAPNATPTTRRVLPLRITGTSVSSGSMLPRPVNRQVTCWVPSPSLFRSASIGPMMLRREKPECRPLVPRHSEAVGIRTRGDRRLATPARFTMRPPQRNISAKRSVRLSLNVAYRYTVPPQSCTA